MYSAGSVKWGEPTLGEPSGTINWNADGLALDGMSESQITSTLISAFDAWEAAAAVDFQYSTSGVSLTLDDASLSGSVAGTASITFDGNAGLSEIFTGGVEFNSNLNWSPFGGGGTDFYAVALHEIGHILGLNHVDDETEIMNPVVYAENLGDGDIAGVQFLYGTDGGDTPAPLEPVEGGRDDSGDGGGGGAIGLLIGLLALVFSMFTGGGGAAVALAAGRWAEDDDPDDNDVHLDEVFSDLHAEDLPGGSMVASHTSYVPEMPLPMIAFEERPNYEEDDEDPFFI